MSKRRLFVFFGFHVHPDEMKNTAWKALKGRLEGGAVLRHVAGFVQPVETGRDCQFHEHPTIELVFHPSGRGVTAVQGGGRVEFSEGDVVLYAPGARHDQRVSANGIDCCVQIEAPEGAKLGGYLHVGWLDDVVLRGELEYLSARSPGGSGAGDALLNLRTTAVLLQLLELALATADVETGRLEAHVRAAEKHVQDHYATIGSVEEIAAAAGVGPDHLRHVFRRRRGRSLIGYLNEVRLTRAMTLLAYADLPIKEIAGLCGYRDEYYFSAVFKRRHGCAPGRYRERARAAGRVSVR